MKYTLKYIPFFEKDTNSNIVDEIKKFFKPVKDMGYDPEELKKGIKVEREHVNNDEIAEIVAKHHLAEDPAYYTKLATLKL